MNEQQCLELINDTPALQSLLCDLRMMPEPNSSAWPVIIAIANAYKAGRDSVPLNEVAF